MINCLRNPRASVFSDKWRFDLSQDWETLALDFERFSKDDLANKTFRALGFYISTTGYLEERSLRFIDVTDLELTTEPTVMDNAGQVVTDFKEEVVKKKNKHIAKKKSGLQNFMLLLDLVRLFVLDPPLFCCLVVCPFLFFVLDPLLFCRLVCARSCFLS